MANICEIDGCVNPKHGRGLCTKHYKQYCRNIAKDKPRDVEWPPGFKFPDDPDPGDGWVTRLNRPESFSPSASSASTCADSDLANK